MKLVYLTMMIVVFVISEAIVLYLIKDRIDKDTERYINTGREPTDTKYISAGFGYSVLCIISGLIWPISILAGLILAFVYALSTADKAFANRQKRKVINERKKEEMIRKLKG